MQMLDMVGYMTNLSDNLYVHIQETLWTYSSNIMHKFKIIYVHIFKTIHF